MSVSNYLAKTSNGCSYKYDKLKNKIYLVSDEHLKKVYIDNGEAYITNLTESPIKIDGFNIDFKEETSLDERYKFQKTLTISVNGYATFEDLNKKYYAIIETVDGTFYMINVDFPSKVTHTYNLSENQNQTDFTFSSVSNFPALKLNGFNPSNSVECKQYKINGIDSLKMLESLKTRLSTASNMVIATEAFKIVEYLSKTCTFQEAYDGNKFETTLEFQISFDNYKSSWHYNLLEFIMNNYAAIIGIKNSSNKIYAGFEYGLEPNYTVNASNAKDQPTDIITITLKGTSNKGLIYGDLMEYINSTTSWIYINKIGNKNAYDCVDEGVAMYLLQQEIYYDGTPTGNYKVFVGYESWFPELNIIGTFDTIQTFYEPTCTGGGDEDEIITDIPSTVIFNGGSGDTCTVNNCFTYNIRSNRNWQIVEIPSNLTASRLNGNANTDYTITLCNNASPNDLATIEGQLKIKYGKSYFIADTKVLRIRYKWRESNYYYCSNGGKYVAEFQYESRDGGNNYQENGVTRLGRLVENNSSFCTSAVTYEWRATDKWGCDGGTPEPSGCTAFIVDGGHWSVNAEGGTGCDSAFLYIDGTPIFYINGSSASTCDWITINLYHWDEDDISHFCTWYNYYPCVANNLMYLADLVPNSADCRTASSRIGDYPEIVQDAINKTGEYAHALGTVEYVVAPNTTQNVRSCTIKWYVDDIECPSREYIINQTTASTPSGECVCSSFDVRGKGVTVSSAITSSEYNVAKYTGATNCSEPLVITKESGDGFMGNFRYSSGNIYGKVISGNTYSARQDKYKVQQGDCIGYFYVNQQKGYVPPSTNEFKWNIANSGQSYSATVSGNSTFLSLAQFSSSVNGSYVNATLSADTSWIITNNSGYVNGNEMSPGVNNILYLSANQTSSARTGTLVLTQKGTSNKIYCYITQGAYQPNCTITQFNISSSVKKGSPITYSYMVADPRCSQTFHFYLYDSNHNEIHVTNTPSQGIGAGEISTSGASVGTASISVPVNGELKNYYVDIANDNVITCKFVIHNNLSYTIYPSKMSINKNGAPAIVLDIGQKTIYAGGGLNITKELSSTLQNYVFNYLTVRDDWNENKTYSASVDSTTLTDNGTIHVYITGVIS